jgi:hypothetical protein
MVAVSNMPSEKKPTMLDGIQTLKPTPRVERLREAFLSLKPSASIDRARIETRVSRYSVG